MEKMLEASKKVICIVGERRGKAKAGNPHPSQIGVSLSVVV